MPDLDRPWRVRWRYPPKRPLRHGALQVGCGVDTQDRYQASLRQSWLWITSEDDEAIQIPGAECRCLTFLFFHRQ
ncbi:MAG TPA: hypothetical protein VI078_02760 [bacterium]